MALAGDRNKQEYWLRLGRSLPPSVLILSSSLSFTSPSKPLLLSPCQDVSPSPLKGTFGIPRPRLGLPGPLCACSTAPQCSPVTSVHYPLSLQSRKFLFSLPPGAIGATGVGFLELQSQSDPSDQVGRVGSMSPVGHPLISFEAPEHQRNSLAGRTDAMVTAGHWVSQSPALLPVH